MGNVVPTVIVIGSSEMYLKDRDEMVHDGVEGIQAIFVRPYTSISKVNRTKTHMYYGIFQSSL